MTQISLRKHELAGQVRLNDLHTPCRWNPKGLTHKACADTSAIPLRNTGCANMQCTSPMRVCKVCVTSGEEWQPIIDFKTGLCERHQGAAPIEQISSPYERWRETPDAASFNVFMQQTKDDRRPPLPPILPKSMAEYASDPNDIARLLATIDDRSKRVARSIIQGHTVEEMAEWLSITFSQSGVLRHQLYQELGFHRRLPANKRHETLCRAFDLLGWDPNQPVSAAMPTSPDELIESGVHQIKRLGPQESDVFNLIGKGHSSDYVSKELNIRLRQVHTVIGKIYQVLGIAAYVPEGRRELLIGIWLKASS